MLRGYVFPIKSFYTLEKSSTANRNPKGASQRQMIVATQLSNKKSFHKQSLTPGSLFLSTLFLKTKNENNNTHMDNNMENNPGHPLTDPDPLDSVIYDIIETEWDETKKYCPTEDEGLE
jgi:hypothetical protein